MNLPFSFRLLIVVLMSAVWATSALAVEITPFRTTNLNPLIQIYGLPSETSSTVLAAGIYQLQLTQDIASLYSTKSTANEHILLDGELYRWTLAGRYGITDRLELGLELPVTLQGGGFLDGFIMDWHRVFGLPQGGRDTAPKNKLRYYYSRNGVKQLDMSHASGGIGDLSILGAYRLFEQQTETDHDTLALRSQLKLPTGDSASLRGSGGVDIALFLSGAMNRRTEWGTLGLFASVGGLYTSDGDILKNQRENFVGFGSTGLGWSPADWVSFKVQCSLTSAFYNQSSLSELGKATALLTTGGTLKLPGNYQLDIAVGEDIAVATAPDVTFHLGLSKKF